MPTGLTVCRTKLACRTVWRLPSTTQRALGYAESLVRCIDIRALSWSEESLRWFVVCVVVTWLGEFAQLEHVGIQPCWVQMGHVCKHALSES